MQSWVHSQSAMYRSVPPYRPTVGLLMLILIPHDGVGPLAQQIASRRTAAFGHIARLADKVPARLALCCQVDASLGQTRSSTQ